MDKAKIGVGVLESSSITGIRQLYVNGTNGLSSSTIVTEINDDNVRKDNVFMYIAGNNDYAYNVHCTMNDTCFIICQTIDACSQMTLYCQGLCYVSCSNNYTPNCYILTILFLSCMFFNMWTSTWDDNDLGQIALVTLKIFNLEIK